jgi:peptide/nickel transport system substrate-binding protein
MQADKTGKFQGIGYQTGKSATLVRNPNWSAAGDYRPANLDQINVNIGGSATVIGQQVLKGTNAVELDTPDRSIVKLAYEQYPSQITFTPGSGTHYAALDNHHGPFTNVNLRRAVWAALDRNAIVKARGGPLVAAPMTHFLYPGVNGYEQAGGAAGPQVDYNANPNGDMTVATKYMKAAGYPSGKYTGNQVLQVVGNNTGVSPAVISIIDQTLTSLGFKTHVTQVGQSVMYAKYCGVPKQEIDVCPTVGWIRDYADPQTVLYPTFWGPGIVPTNNSNWGQANWQDAPTVHTGPSTTAIDQAMDKAALVVGDAARAQAWANIDKMLVDQAVAVPQEFDSQPNIQGSTVVPANQLWNVGEPDFSFTSLK